MATTKSALVVTAILFSIREVFNLPNGANAKQD